MDVRKLNSDLLKKAYFQLIILYSKTVLEEARPEEGTELWSQGKTVFLCSLGHGPGRARGKLGEKVASSTSPGAFITPPTGALCREGAVSALWEPVCRRLDEPSHGATSFSVSGHH